MKHFTITTTDSALTIKRNLAGVLHLRLSLIVSILIASATIAFLVNRQIMHLDSKYLEFFLIFGVAVILGSLIFYRDLFRNSFTIRKSGSGFIINGRKELDRESLEYILEEGYSTKEHIEDFKKVRIKTRTGVITIDSGVNPADRPEIIESLVHFLGLDPTSTRSLIW